MQFLQFPITISVPINEEEPLDDGDTIIVTIEIEQPALLPAPK